MTGMSAICLPSRSAKASVNSSDVGATGPTSNDELPIHAPAELMLELGQGAQNRAPPLLKTVGGRSAHMGADEP
jgi:hypothetical protein